MSVENLDEIHQQLDEYLAKVWIKSSISPYRAPILLYFQKRKNASNVYQFQGSK